MVKTPAEVEMDRKKYERWLFWRKVGSACTSGLARFCVIIYFIIAHILRVVIWPAGLTIEYVNHKPWPYRDMLRTFFEPWDDV